MNDVPTVKETNEVQKKHHFKSAPKIQVAIRSTSTDMVTIFHTISDNVYLKIKHNLDIKTIHRIPFYK